MLDFYAVRMKKDDINCSGVEELHDLNLLEELKIVHLQNVRGPIDAGRANLKGKLNIRRLYLSWAYEDDDEGRSNRDVVLLEALQPHPNNLKVLYIYGFLGLWFPMWMGGCVSSSSSSCLLINLVELNLQFCNRCEHLPALGQLPSLRNLCIDGMKSLRCLGEELYGGGGDFPSLIELRLYNMESLEEWFAPPPSKLDNRCTSFPLLEELNILECPKLITTPTSFPSLKEVKVWNIKGEAVSSITSGSMTSLTSLDICEVPKLIYLPNGLLRCLRDLNIKKCEHFKGFRDLDYGGDISSDEDEVAKSVSGTHELLNNCCSLQTLVLIDCPVLTFLPDFQGLTTLKSLTIRRCNDELKKSLPSDRNCLTFIGHLDVDF